jgi:hypothetical protein
MNTTRSERCLRQFADSETAVVGLIQRSFLSKMAQVDFLARFRDRLRAITD